VQSTGNYLANPSSLPVEPDPLNVSALELGCRDHLEGRVFSCGWSVG